MTKTREKDNEISEAFRKGRDELRAVILKEFPVGTKVKWQHGSNWLEGVVVESAPYDWSTDLQVKNSKSGKTVKKEATDFELA